MRFKKIYIEILNTCNLNCSFCIQNSRKPQQMTLDQFEHVLKQIHPYTKYIYLHILGEPLMHPQLKEFLALAHQYQFHVNLTTNGTLLEKQLDVLLQAKALRQINISIHAKLDDPNYLKEILKAGDKLSAQGIYVSYRLWQYRQGHLDPQVLSVVHQLNEHYHTSIIPSKQSFQLQPHCFVSFDEQFEWPSLSHPFVSFTGSCQGWRQMAGILCDGRVVPCCLDTKADINLGNIFEEDFSLILSRNESLLTEIRNHQFTKELCQKCSYRTRFDH